MWKDGNTDFDNYLNSILSGDTPSKMECCATPEIHYFFYKHKKNRGSAWVWCSKCRSFAHYDGVLLSPDYENCNEISLSDLSAIPEKLERKKEMVDRFNQLQR